MTKHVILITGTPCVGKTSVAHMLASNLDALYVNLTEMAVTEKLVLGKDKKRNSIIIDETRMQRRIRQLITNTEKDVIIDGHYAVNVVPKQLVTHVFVLRRNPVELRKLMEKCGFSDRKLCENLASEILDVCLVDALNVHEKGKICELNVSSKSVKKIVNEILDILHGKQKCRIGIVDWLGTLESQGLLDNYLKI